MVVFLHSSQPHTNFLLIACISFVTYKQSFPFPTLSPVLLLALTVTSLLALPFPSHPHYRVVTLSIPQHPCLSAVIPMHFFSLVPCSDISSQFFHGYLVPHHTSLWVHPDTTFILMILAPGSVPFCALLDSCTSHHTITASLRSGLPFVE